MRNWSCIAALTLALCAAPLTACAAFAYIGTYTPNGEGIYRVEVEKASGALSQPVLVARQRNPAQLTVDAQGKTLYAASEVADYQQSQHGAIVAWRIEANGDLSKINEVDAQGAGPVYLSLTPDGRQLLVANYISGSVAGFALRPDGGLGDALFVHQDDGPAGAEKPAAAVPGSFAVSDHNGPHVHMIQSDRSGRFVYSTDLGLDRIYQWKRDLQSGLLTPNDPPWIAASSAGAGPRHFVLTPDDKMLILINEESSTLTQYHKDDAGKLSEIRSISALPASCKGTSFASGLVLSQDGRHLYVANRLHNSISHFTLDDAGKLTLADNVWTRGDYPRTLALSPDNQYVYALNQRSDTITRFQIDAQSGALTFVEEYLPIGSPSQMVFVPDQTSASPANR